MGRIKKIISEKEYGFIIDEQTKEEFFFHKSVFKGDWDRLVRISPPLAYIGPEVLFKVIDHKKGPRAIKVEVLI